MSCTGSCLTWHVAIWRWVLTSGDVYDKCWVFQVCVLGLPKNMIRTWEQKQPELRKWVAFVWVKFFCLVTIFYESLKKATLPNCIRCKISFVLHRSDPSSLVLLHGSLPDILTPNESVSFLPARYTLTNSVFCSLTFKLQSLRTEVAVGRICVRASRSSSRKSTSSAYSDSSVGKCHL